VRSDRVADRGSDRRRHRDDQGLPVTFRAERARPGVPFEERHFDRWHDAEPGEPTAAIAWARAGRRYASAPASVTGTRRRNGVTPRLAGLPGAWRFTVGLGRWP
jgi:hypothetical protein